MLNVMLRRIRVFLICIVFAFSVLLILTGSRYSGKICYHQPSEIQKTIKHNLKTEDSEDGLLQPILMKHYDGSPDRENIFESTRLKIEYDLRNYNFTHSGVHQLQDLLMESGGRPLRNVIISTWRSGSTFLSELLNAIPGNFFNYEPLFKFGVKQIRGPPHAAEAVSILKGLLKCDYSGMTDVYESAKTYLESIIHLKYNIRLWNHCLKYEELCYDTNFLTNFCKLFPFQSMKVCRLRLHLVTDILEDKELNVKVVLLIRDPRGVMNSRHLLPFCQPSPDCSKPELLCADMISDYEAAERLLQMYPDRLMVVRFEELVSNLRVTTLQLLKFLRFGAIQSVEEFLQTHTNVVNAGVFQPFDTHRVSRNVPFKWKNALGYEYVKELQEVCKEAMELWGYKLAHNASHMASQDFYPLEPYTLRRSDTTT